MKTQLRLGLFSAALSLAFACSAHAAGPGHTLYRVVSLGDPEGGTLSQGTSDNQQGWILGLSTLPGNTLMQAQLWRDGTARSLGTLGGPDSAVAWPNRNHHGLIVGIAETAELQPLQEAWSCGLAVFPTVDGHVCRGFVWRDGSMTALPTLGGYNGFATGVNDRGEIVGWAEDSTRDPTCGEFTNNHQVLQFEAVMWVPDADHDDGIGNADERYHAIALPPYPGDLDGAATAINQAGEVAGISGVCDGAVGGGTAQHMLVWQNGRIMRALPTLGGAYWNTPMDINDRGDVAGFSDLPGDGPTPGQANFMAFFWSARSFTCNGQRASGGGTCNLGALGSDGDSEALGVNNEDQVVGVSFGASNPYPGHAFIWQNGKMTDLNTLVVPGTPLVLNDAQDINDSGVITGEATDPSTGAEVAFEAIPVE